MSQLALQPSPGPSWNPEKASRPPGCGGPAGDGCDEGTQARRMVHSSRQGMSVEWRTQGRGRSRESRAALGAAVVRGFQASLCRLLQPLNATHKSGHETCVCCVELYTAVIPCCSGRTCPHLHSGWPLPSWPRRHWLHLHCLSPGIKVASSSIDGNNLHGWVGSMPLTLIGTGLHGRVHSYLVHVHAGFAHRACARAASNLDPPAMCIPSGGELCAGLEGAGVDAPCPRTCTGRASNTGGRRGSQLAP